MMTHARLVSIGAVIAVVIVLLVLLTGCDPASASLDESYDRDLFGDYDRELVLAQNFSAWPNCDGYYSAADDKCYVEARSVHVDHIVSLKEAWLSGASSWTRQKRDEFAGDLDNLWLMTAGLNMSKGDDDIAEWLPPHSPAICDYITAYVDVKTKWNLSLDPEELRVNGC